MANLEIIRLPDGITTENQRIEVWIPPTKAPDNWPPLDPVKQDPPTEGPPEPVNE